MMNPNFFGRCRECKGRPTKGIDGLVGGICKRCWTQASGRIRARFSGDTDGELRYSFHGHARPFHSRKRNSASRAEVLPANDPGVGGLDVSKPTGEHSVAPSALPAAVPGAESSAAPAFALAHMTILPGGLSKIEFEPGYRTRAEADFAVSRLNRLLG